MKELDKGHIYELNILDADAHFTPHTLQFVKRKGPKYPGNTDAYPGTNCQEVTRALIARAEYINQQTPCWQTRLSIYLLATVNWLYEHRAARRHGRRVPGFWQATYDSTCGYCGHVSGYAGSHADCNPLTRKK